MTSSNQQQTEAIDQVTDPKRAMSEEIREMWAAAEAAAEKRGVTSPARMLTPNCPSWCDGPHRAGDLDFELDENDVLFRWHSSRTRVVEETRVGADRRSGVEWWLSVAEYLDGSRGPVMVSMETFGGGGPFLTADQARKVARSLLEDADMAEQGGDERPVAGERGGDITVEEIYARGFAAGQRAADAERDT